ncbi:4'-phosphopantetheinyl transferase family protein [Zongyangia hominis]|uniref:4'-phosphopantetheinyl transferase superfamily protein n=1 Tax=Zongyangia hominis TaxID=2763677 RepID=A0A926EA66_9FIRM|nr:4'-phosphopantetheinyl transferase superfamily protein [Zongyangia hominis]MBC8569288.1 4'-phosphopantetheinyl transferase superfamily protein [Zongyangia hominis]
MADFTIIYYPPESVCPPAMRLSRAAALLLDREPEEDEALYETKRGVGGKPYFVNMPGLHFSLSHSGGHWMCAFGSEPVGLDLQRKQTCDRARISRRFFHPEEDDYLRRTGYRDFFCVWAAKESFVKLTGQGVGDEMRLFSVAGEAGIRPSVEGMRLFFPPFDEDFALCLCAREIGQVKILYGR